MRHLLSTNRWQMLHWGKRISLLFYFFHEQQFYSVSQMPKSSLSSGDCHQSLPGSQNLIVWAASCIWITATRLCPSETMLFSFPSWNPIIIMEALGSPRLSPSQGNCCRNSPPITCFINFFPSLPINTHICSLDTTSLPYSQLPYFLVSLQPMALGLWFLPSHPNSSC